MNNILTRVLITLILLISLLSNSLMGEEAQAAVPRLAIAP